jgi:gamma-glutamylcyclotransferase (GGCT)/AIG2-like uncharacterized protein YtfP
MDLFVYGTLMDPDFVRQLTGKGFAIEPAHLPDFRRFQTPGSYPYILPHAGDSVDGVLLRNVDENTLRAFDRYEDEGNLYFRTKVVALVEGVPRDCEVYVANVSALGRLEIA